MEKIIWAAGDEPEDEPPATSDQYDLNPVYEVITPVLNKNRPARYNEKDKAWLAPAEELAFSTLMSDSTQVESIVRLMATRAVRDRERVAKRRATDLFSCANDQLPLGYGDLEAMKDFLRGCWHLPVRVNEAGDMVRLGSMLPADWNEKDSYDKDSAKKQAERNQNIIDSTAIFKGLADTGPDDSTFESLFDLDDDEF